jgi:hypothetical protein
LDALVPLYLIEPNEKKYIIRIFLPDGIDRMQIQPGQKTLVSIEGFPDQASASLHAEIISAPYLSEDGNKMVVDAISYPVPANRKPIPAFVRAKARALLITGKKRLIEKLF